MVYQQPSKKPASDDTTYFSKSSQKEQQESFGGNFAPNQSDERLNGQSLPEYSSRGWDLLKAKFARTRPKDGIQGNQESSEQPEAKLPLQTDQNSESALSNSDSSKNLEKQVFPADENKALAFKQTNSAHSSTLISQANQSVQPSETEFRFQLILPPDVIQKIQQKQLYGKKLRDELLVLLFMQLEGKSRSSAEFLVNNKLRDWSFYKEPTEKELNQALMAVLVTNPPPGEASQTGSPAGKIQKQNSERDAQELRRALQQGSKTEQTIIRILNQPPQIVQQILEIYNSQYNTLSGKGLFVDIKIKLNAIDSEGLERYWEFVVAQFQLAGIYIPPYILQNEKLEKLEYYRQNDTNNNKHFVIVAEPKNTIAATQTQITYSVQVLRDEVFDKKPNYQYQWYILNDPETVKNNPNVPAQYYHEGNVGSRWENAEWKYPGNHKVICRVQVNDRPPVYIEYQQTVLPREVVLDESLKKAPIPPDPSQQSILLKNYQKALLNAEQQKGSNSLDPKVKEQLQAQNDELDKKLLSTDGLKRHPIKAIYLSKQGAKTFPLNVFVAQTEDRLGSPWAGRYTWNLVDITNPTDQRMSGEYSGMGHTHQEAIQAAINKWNQNNRYYPGVIKLEVPEAVAGKVIKSDFETDGKNFWDSLSQFLDVIGFVTGIASILTFAIPVLSIPLASVSIAASTAGATIRLVQRRVEERPDPAADTLDILTIVSNVFAGVWLRGVNARLNGTASTNFNNGILIGQLAVDGSTGVILNAVYLKRYEEIMQIKDPQERTDKLIKLFQEAALSNGLLSLSITSTVKDIDAINRMRTSRETVEIDPSFVENPGTTSGASQVGGVRGNNVYELGNTYTSGGETRGALNAGRLEKVKNKIATPTTGYLHGAKVTHVDNGTHYTVSIPTSTGSTTQVSIEVIPTPTDRLSSPHAHHSSTGNESGPARLDLDYNGTTWNVKIEVDSLLFQEDAAIVINHEINEAVDIIHQHPNGPPLDGVTYLMEASVFKQGSATTTPTSHDRAAVVELRILYEDLSNLKKSGGSSDKIARRQNSIKNQLESMGLEDPVNLDTKLKLLRQAGVPEEGIRHVELVGARAELKTHLDRETAAGHTSNSIMSEELVRHLMYPEEQGGFRSSGIYGGHETQRLLDFADNSDRYIMVERAIKSFAGTTFRRFDQYSWKGTGPKPKPSDPNFPGGSAFNASDWIIANVPKTTADNIQVYLSEGADAWRNWLALYGPGSATPYAIKKDQFGGVQSVPPAVSTNGVQFGGFFKYDSNTNIWTINTIFIEASWI